MRMAWPERIVLIVVAALVVLVVEFVIVLGLNAWRAPSWLYGLYALTAIIIDLWAIFRAVDRLFAGPARRRKDKIVRFSP